jgi:hypothetical protein
MSNNNGAYNHAELNSIVLNLPASALRVCHGSPCCPAAASSCSTEDQLR